MEDERKLKNLLNMSSLEKNWYLKYGITERRKESLLEDPDHRGSLLNANSETTLSLFLLGNIDNWVQAKEKCLFPRDKNSKWNREFFKELKEFEDSELKNQIEKKSTLWKNQQLSSKLEMKKDELNKNILLFEVEFCNKMLQGDKEKYDVSFLDIRERKKWIRYDAVLIFPSEKKFVFIESKFKSDIGTTTKNYPGIDQLIRGLEAAFLTTHHPSSDYSDWDFNYLVLGQKLLDDYTLTKYNEKLDDLGPLLVEYNEKLNNKYRNSTNENCYPEYFGEFIKKVPERVKKIYWKDLGDMIKRKKPDFFNQYLENLRENPFDEKTVDDLLRKFKEAGIRFQYDT